MIRWTLCIALLSACLAQSAAELNKRQTYISIHVSPTLLNSSAEWLAVTVENAEAPLPTDWIGVYPATVHGELDYHNYRRIKYQYTSTDPNYVKIGIGKYRFRLVNLRQDYILGVFDGRGSSPILQAASQVIRFREPNKPLQVHLSLGRDPSEMTVVWSTKSSIKNQLCWGDSPEALGCVAAQVSTYAPSDLCGSPGDSTGWSNPGQILSATMTGLRPSTRYYYKAGSFLSVMSDTMTFKSPPSPSPGATVSLVALGNTGYQQLDDSSVDRGGAHRPLNTFNAILSLVNASKADLVMHLGGLSFATGYSMEWDNFFTGIEPIASRVPYMTCIGDAEMDFPGSKSLFQDKNSGGECGVPYQRRLIMPRPNGDETKHWYGFDYGSVHVVVMSTEFNFSSGSEQYLFLDDHLSSVDRSKTPWLIFTGHRPMYVDSLFDKISTSPPVSKQLQNHIEPLLQKHRVDLALWGHHGSYQRTCPVVQDKCTRGATSHVVVGGGGAGLQKDRQGGIDWLEYIDDQNYGFATITASSRSLLLEYHRSNNGKVYDTLELTK